MKAKSILPWIFVLAFGGAAFALWTSNQKLQSELTQLRSSQTELTNLREQVAELSRLETLEPELERLKKESAEVHKLRNEARQLREESKQLNAQLQEAQGKLSGSADRLAQEIQQLRNENQQLKSAAPQEAVPIEQTLEEYKNVCIANLRQLDGAQEQWALENQKTAGDIPEYEALLTYLASPPACPQGGSYTIAGVGKKPSCNMENHKLP